MKHILTHHALPRGEDGISLPDARRTQRLFGVGRTKGLSTHIKYEKLGDESAYEPRSDTCIRAFVRLLAQAATAAGGGN